MLLDSDGRIRAAEEPAANVPIRSSHVVDLNVLTFRLATNLPTFDGFTYFSRFAADETPVDYEVTCIDTTRDRVDLDQVSAASDKTFRGKRFRDGFYLVHYFGQPAYLVTRGNRFAVYGTELERTVWPYFVKQMLTIRSVDQDYLHLKAAAFAQAGAGATLLVGRNGGGKTVFLTQACQGGASFVANTHVFVKDGTLLGVPSAIRVRDDACFAGVATRLAVGRHLESQDFLVPPEQIFDRTQDHAPVRNVVIVDYQPAEPQELREISSVAAVDFLEQFSLGISVYGLKDDVLVHCGYDFDRYVRAYRAMKTRLDEVAGQARCFYANVDMLDTARRDDVLATLGSP